MQSIVIHQVVHGYREGHRLLCSSVQLSADADRALLIMSDMSGPAMQPGFEEYITGYALPATSSYVLAKTWYAPEMKRPGCVWTHSLLIQEGDLGGIQDVPSLLRLFQRPTSSSAAMPALEPLAFQPSVVQEERSAQSLDRLSHRDFGRVVVVLGALYDGSNRPVLLIGDTAAEFEELLLLIWFQQWPKLRATFSFCTGALTPRSCGQNVLDLQVVPCTSLLSRLRKSAADAAVIDWRDPVEPPHAAPWAGLLAGSAGVQTLTGIIRWLSDCAEEESSRELAGRLCNLFPLWQRDPPAEPGQVLRSVDRELGGRKLHTATVSRLLGQVFALFRGHAGENGEVSVLAALSTGAGGAVFSPAADEVVNRAHCLFAASREMRPTVLANLLASNLSPVGERVLDALFACLDVVDALELSALRPELLPTVVRANPRLACSPDLWSQASVDRRDLVSALGDSESATPTVIRAVIGAIAAAGAEDIASDVVREVGRVAVDAVLDAARSGDLAISQQWTRALACRPTFVVSWLEGREADETDLSLVSGSLDPNDAAIAVRCVRLWWAALSDARGRRRHDATVAAFGLALGFGTAGPVEFIVEFFQDVCDAFEASNLDREAWSWLKTYAPPLSRWRDWDRCERLTAATTTRLVACGVPPADFLRAIRSETALRHAIRALRRLSDGRSYLQSLRQVCRSDDRLATELQCRLLLRSVH